MPAGSIVISLLMATGAFETDTKRAEKRLQEFQKQAEKTGKAIGVGIAAGVTLAAAAFDQLVKAAADFKDLEETIGASAEDIASLAIAAATAGVSMDSVTAATIKLTKGLTGVDDESKAAGAALAALGLNIEDFKRLDPVAQYEAVGKALAGFADGAKKTAVAVTLFGKSGAEQLRVFKALEEQGGRQVILTQKQIELADAYADRQAKQTATLKLYAAAAATDMLPALNDLTAAATELVREFTGIDSAGKKLAGESPVKAFAEGAVDSLAFLVDAGQGVARVFQTIGKFLAGTAAVATAVATGQLAAAKEISKQLDEDVAKILSAELFSQRLARTRDASKRAAEISNDSETQRLAARSRASLPSLEFDGAQKAVKAAKDKTTEADRYLEGLEKQVQKTAELTEVEKVLDDILKGRFQGAKAGQANRALALADELDRAKLLTEQNKTLVDQAEQLEQASNKLRDAGKKVFEETRTPAEQYAAQLAQLNQLLEAGAINHDTYARAVHKLQDEFDENAQRIKGIAQGINSSLEGGFADAFAGFVSGSLSAKDAFKSFADSVIHDLLRIASQDIAKSILGGGKDGTGGLGGLLAGLFSQGSSAGTYPSISGGSAGGYVIPQMATGTNYVPYDGFVAKLHKGESVVPRKYNPAAGGARGDTVQIVTPPGMPLQTSSVQNERQPDGTMLKKIILETMLEDARSGGPHAQATGGRYGLKPQTPRRR